MAKLILKIIEVDFKDNNFTGTLKPSTNRDEINVIEISPSQPYQLIIGGKILQNESNSGILFDFGEFEIFNKPRKGEFKLWGFWLPIDHDPVDS